MKRVAMIAIAVIIALSAGACGVKEVAGTPGKVYPVTGSYEYLKEFLAENKNRTAGSEGEALAAEFLRGKFEELGLTSVDVKKFALGSEKQSQNVVGRLKGTASEYQVIIGAHYDNVFGNASQGSNAEGAYDNGTGIATMLAVADHLTTGGVELGFDVMFVAFGAEETGLYGSKAYVENLTPGERKSTLLMVNLDVVGGGDYLYLYCDEVKTGHEELLHKHATEIGAAVNRPPANKKVFYMSNQALPYSHYGLSSDNVSFLAAGINTASFFSVNWSTVSKAGVTESKANKAIMHTSSDTLEVLERVYGDSFKEKMDATASVVVSALGDSDFFPVMLSSSQNKTDYSLWNNGLFFNLIKAVLVAGMFLLIALLSKHYTRKYPIVIMPAPASVKPKVFDDYEDGPDNGGNSQGNPFDGY